MAASAPLISCPATSELEDVRGMTTKDAIECGGTVMWQAYVLEDEPEDEPEDELEDELERR